VEVDGQPLNYPCAGSVDGDPSDLLVVMLRAYADHIERGLVGLRRTIADAPPESCQPDHAEPEEVSLGFGGITYQCLRCGDVWFRPIRPGEPV